MEYYCLDLEAEYLNESIYCGRFVLSSNRLCGERDFRIIEVPTVLRSYFIRL